MNISKQNAKPGKIDSKYLLYSYNDDEFVQSDEYSAPFYKNSNLFTRLLLKKKGKRAVIDFLKHYRRDRTKKTYDALFEKLRSGLRVGE
jgi:predicted ABC-type exoprotein transport system permease subunit